jgi:glutaryl-CoA dehydrogenase
MQLPCWRASTLAVGRWPAHRRYGVTGKLHCSSRARSVVADARDICGVNGILVEHDGGAALRRYGAVFTVEGTDLIQVLIVGREITGIQAISPGGKPV